MTALLGLAALSTGFALDPAVAFFGKDAANGLVAYLCYGSVFFLVFQLARGTRRILELTRAMVASGVVASVFSLYQAIFMTPARVKELGLLPVAYLYGRGGGLFGNPDYVGAFLVAPFILAITLTLAEKDRRFRLAAGIAMAIIGAAAVVAQVRGGWLGIIMGLVVLAIVLFSRVRPSGKQLLIGAGVVVVAIVIGLLVANPGQVAERVGSGLGKGLNEFSGGRIEGWRAALGVIGDRPLLGTGPDSFTLGWYRQVTTLSDPGTGIASYFEDPHDLPLAIASTMGIPALLALLALGVFAIRAGLSSVKRAAEMPAQRALFAGLLGAFAGLVVASLFGVTTIPLALSFFTLAAALAAPAASTREIPATPLLVARTVAGLVAVTCLVAAMVPLIADYHLGQFKRTGIESELLTARSIAPWNMTIQEEYIDYRRAQLIPLLQQGGTPAAAAIDAIDADTFQLTTAHPYELAYVLKRVDILGQAAGQIAGPYPEKALTVVNLAVLDHPQLVDLVIAKARALNNLERYDESIALLEPLPRSLHRDATLAESYLLAKQTDEGGALVRDFKKRYAGTQLGDAFLAQPNIAPYAK